MSSIGPQLPPHLQHLNDNNSNDSDSGEEESTVAGPQIPPELLKVRSESAGPAAPPLAPQDEEEDDDDYTPALPPDLVASRSSGPEAGPSIANRKIQGPVLPSSNPGYDDDSDDDVGPMPLPPGYEGLTEVDGVKQFLEQEEKRRKNIEEAAKPKALKRDEWMLVPPSSSDLLGTLDPKKLSKGRQFSKSAAPAKNNDMSLWTETPAERQQRLADEVSGKKRKAVNAEPTISPEEAMEARKRRKRDEVIRQSVLDHTKNVRGGALVDTHAKSMEKDDKEDPNAKAIWDHSRDMSIGGRLMDDSQRNKLIRDARGLGDRFSTGKSGGFL